MTDQRRQVEIETLLQWAYRDELPKRGLSSAEGIWGQIEELGRGGIDPGHGAAQRYPHFGLPHPDALAIELKVSQLADGALNWEAEAPDILGDLIALCEPRNANAGHSTARRARAGWRNGEKMVRVNVDAPRQVIMVRTLRPSALIAMHARMGTRPDWRSEPPEPEPVPAERGPNAKIVGECWAKNVYSPGSYCPLKWTPSPITIAESRADYLAWWRGLWHLAATLNLGAHIVLHPSAPEFPWRDGEDEPIVHAEPRKPMSRLPLNPQRPTMGPPLRTAKYGPVRNLGETRQNS